MAYSRKKQKTAAAKKDKTEGREVKLSDMGLFELSIHSLMPEDVFKELINRIKLIQTLLNKGCLESALETVNGLLKSPQETRRQKFKY
jgi:hypothetical protein